jgi:septum formation protein
MSGYLKMAKSKIKFILASASPRRKELITHLKIPFDILALNGPEYSDSSDPVTFAKDIAENKGQVVLDKLRLEKPGESFYVVSADTIVCLNGKIFGKPKDREEAKEFLNQLSGQSHSVFTAVSLKLYYQNSSYSKSFVEESKVTFNVISDQLMKRYLDTGDSLDKSGAYGIQGPSLTFISKVEGDYANVVGFPLSRFINESEEFLKLVFPQEDLWLELF